MKGRQVIKTTCKVARIYDFQQNILIAMYRQYIIYIIFYIFINYIPIYLLIYKIITMKWAYKVIARSLNNINLTKLLRCKLYCYIKQYLRN